ncbi:MAG: zinc-ribbon domain-containing protein [Bacillota bacterium]|nr:zinc-ribbon domain-containing protein [Bacillota bacterium]
MNSKLIVGITDLKTTYPYIAKEWDYQLNEGNPEDYFYGSTKHIHWICSKCGHKWNATIRSRTNKGTGCPKCAIQKRANKRNETYIAKHGSINDPVLLKEWDYEKNLSSPNKYSKGSNKKVHWICSKCGYSYESKINNRTYLNRGCPLCSNQIVVKGKNDLATTHPNIAKEWDYDKNGILTPYNTTHGSGKKVWWKCPEGHSYCATILHRTNGGTNCPICNSGRQTSFAEQAIFYYIKLLYPDAINRYKDIFNNGMELDIYIPSIKLGIEYDGMAWHKKENKERELKKYNICKFNGIKLFRIIEGELDEFNIAADYYLHMDKIYEHKNLEKAIRIIADKLDPESNPFTRRKVHMFHSTLDININRDEKEIRSYMTKINNNFEEKYPLIAEEWHPTKNGKLKPNMFKSGSDIKVFWLCSKCGFEYKTSIGHRTAGTGCPKCAIKRNNEAKMKAVVMMDPQNGRQIKTYKSITEASKETGINSSNISMVCRGQRNKAGGYIWKYKNE